MRETFERSNWPDMFTNAHSLTGSLTHWFSHLLESNLFAELLFFATTYFPNLRTIVLQREYVRLCESAIAMLAKYGTWSTWIIWSLCL